MKISDSGIEVNTPKAREVSSKIRAASLVGLRAYLEKASKNDDLNYSVPTYKESVQTTRDVHAYNELPSPKKEHKYARATEGSSRSHTELKFNPYDQTHSRSHSTPLKSNNISHTLWPSQRSIAFEPASRLDGKVDDGTLWTPTSSPPARLLDTQQAYYASRTDPPEPRTSTKAKKKVWSLILTAALGFIALTVLSFLYFIFMRRLEECILDRNFLSQALGGDLRLNMKSYNHKILRDLERV